MKIADIILNYQNGNNDAILNLISIFKYKIKKLSNNINFDCAESDLIIYLLELSNSINVSKLKNNSNGALINYISKALDNKSYDLYKKYSKYNNEIIEFKDILNSEGKSSNEINSLELFLSLDCLSNIQKKIIVDRYFNGLTDIEISNQLNLSRQSIYSNRIKALKKLKKLFL